MIQLRIKTKLSLGLGFLFGVIILIASLGAIYIHRIAQESKAILVDNYESVQYAKAMLKDMDELDSDTSGFLQSFETDLQLQEKNVTEIGEKEYTGNVRRAFDKLKANGPSPALIHTLRQHLYSITELNLQAILRKNNQAQASADKVLMYIGLIGGFCFLVVFTFIINFPGYIANPIRQLTESIRQIAGKNYHQRLHFSSNDEFGELAAAFNSMAEKLEQYDSSNLAKILFEKKRIEAIINNMNDAIIGLNENRILLFANARATNLLGISETELTGRAANEVALHNDLLRLLLNTNKDSRPIKIYADGKESYFNKEVIAIQSDSKAIGEVILLKNITQFQELDLAKTNFIATISHELKTPIASMKLSLKLLEDARVGSLNQEQQQLIVTMKDDAERLLRITGEVMNMAQVEAGKIQLTIQKVKAADIVKYAVEGLKFLADQKNIRIEEQMGTHLFVDADPEKSTWVMMNLLSNAIRYSPEGGTIRIEVRLQNAQVHFVVADNGQGIDAAYQDKLFDKFFQIPGNVKHGTGLGLAIAKEFIHAQNGDIGLQRSSSEGSTFYFWLPKTPA